jgi:PAS domain-containing protein
MKVFQRPRAPWFPITLLSLALVGLDYVSGPLVQTSLLYIFPIGLAAWFLGKRWSFIFAFGLSLARAYLTWHLWQDTVPTGHILINLGLRSAVYLLISELVARYARSHRLQSRRLDLILAHLPIGVGFCDPKGKILSINPAGNDIWGGVKYVESKQYGQYRGWRPDSNHMLSPEEWALARTLESGKSVLNEVVDIEAFDGTRKTILNSTVMVKDESDTPLGAIFVDQDITQAVQRERENLALIHGLEEAIAKIKVLQGLLPICASCKKIRDDKGNWNQIDVYLHQHSNLDFSHGICPDCAARMYPEFADP